MQVRRPTRIGHGADRLERVTTFAVRDHNTVALEVVVARKAIVAGVVIAAVHVALPELEGCAGDGAAIPRERATDEIERRALGLPKRAALYKSSPSGAGVVLSLIFNLDAHMLIHL